MRQALQTALEAAVASGKSSSSGSGGAAAAAGKGKSGGAASGGGGVGARVAGGPTLAGAKASAGEVSRPPKGAPIESVSSGFEVEVVWRGVTYDRMRKALRRFAQDEESISEYLYQMLLGHSVEKLRVAMPLP